MGVEVKGAGDGVVIADRGLCDLGYKTNSDIRDSRDQMGAAIQSCYGPSLPDGT